MATTEIPQVLDLRPARNPAAPWSSVERKVAPARDRKRAVVYVVAREGSAICKTGCTTALRQRIENLTNETGFRLHVQFWAEFEKDDARLVEAEALRITSYGASIHLPEWRVISPEVAARSILDAAEALSIRPIAMAGFPGAIDPGMTEVEEVLSEMPVIHDRNGRMDRELWAPAARAFSR